jgi:hypothetical protein
LHYVGTVGITGGKEKKGVKEEIDDLFETTSEKCWDTAFCMLFLCLA